MINIERKQIRYVQLRQCTIYSYCVKHTAKPQEHTDDNSYVLATGFQTRRGKRTSLTRRSHYNK